MYPPWTLVSGISESLIVVPGLSKSPTAASFVRPTRPADAPQSFVAALNGKYASEQAAEREPEIQIVFFGKKPAEEVGFDKIRRQLARVEDLTVVILDGTRIAIDVASKDKSVKETSPLVTELDLSRNLFEEFRQVVRICRELEDLRSLRLKCVTQPFFIHDGG